MGMAINAPSRWGSQPWRHHHAGMLSLTAARMLAAGAGSSSSRPDEHRSKLCTEKEPNYE
jgi:hypothetical protein